MIPKIEKILYPTDLSEHGKHVFGYAKAQALAHGAKIIVLHVVEPLPKHTSAVIDSFLPSGAADSQTMHETGVQRLREEMRKRVVAFCDQALPDDKKGLVDDVRVVEGLNAQTILEQAADVDMIVMGTHGHSVLGEIVLGSVAHKVVHRAKIPVMLVPFGR